VEGSMVSLWRISAPIEKIDWSRYPMNREMDNFFIELEFLYTGKPRKGRDRGLTSL
jgi:hypothetical protein